MKNNFRGWRTVFGFTFRQATNGVAFKLVTTLIIVVIFAACILLNILAASKPQQEEATNLTPISKILVLDHSGLSPIDFKAMNPQLNEGSFAHIEIVPSQAADKNALLQEAIKDSSQTIAVEITLTEAGYQLEAIVPSSSVITYDAANAVLIPMRAAFETGKLVQSGLSTEQLAEVLKPIITSQTVIGEVTNTTAYLIKLIAPMIFGLILYMMLLLYGQTISKSVANEKTSKLMETLLTSVHPYALISGKILAITSMAALQFVSWVLSIILGLFAGNAVAHSLYPDYQNSAVAIINFLKDNIGESALSIPAVVLGILTFVIGVLFYNILAGLAGCMVSKPEDVSSTQAIFTLPIVISWLICYMASFSGRTDILKVARFVPFTAPFSTPIDLMTGTISLAHGALSFLVLLAFCFLAIVLAGRIYKGLVLYHGQKVNLKMLGNIIRANK